MILEIGTPLGMSRCFLFAMNLDMSYQLLDPFVAVLNQDHYILDPGVLGQNLLYLARLDEIRTRNDPFYTWGSLMSYICIQEFFDAQVWNDEIKLGSTHKPSGKELRNIPFRNGKLNIMANGETIVKTSQGKTLFTHKGATRIKASDLANQLK